MSDRADGVAVTALSRATAPRRTKSVGCIAYAHALLGDFSEGLVGNEKVFIVQGCAEDSCRVNNKSNGAEGAKAIAGSMNHTSFYKAMYAGVSF